MNQRPFDYYVDRPAMVVDPDSKWFGSEVHIVKDNRPQENTVIAEILNSITRITFDIGHDGPLIPVMTHTALGAGIYKHSITAKRAKLKALKKQYTIKPAAEQRQFSGLWHS